MAAKMKPLNDWKFVLMACLTLGLAPFFPEPHLLGKLSWVAGGAVGMQPLDWFDLAWHGLPWLTVAVAVAHLFYQNLQIY
jgi:hypothetical protein